MSMCRHSFGRSGDAACWGCLGIIKLTSNYSLLKMDGQLVAIGDNDIVDEVEAGVDDFVHLWCAVGCPFCCSGYSKKNTIEEGG